MKSWKTKSQVLFIWLGYAWRQVSGEVQLPGFGFKGIGFFLCLQTKWKAVILERDPRELRSPSQHVPHTVPLQLLTKFQGCALSTHFIRTTKYRVSARCKKKITFNVFPFHLLLQSSENLILHQAIPLASFFFTQLRVMFNDIIPHKRGIDRFHFSYSFFSQISFIILSYLHIIILAIPLKTINLCSFIWGNSKWLSVSSVLLFCHYYVSLIS